MKQSSFFYLFIRNLFLLICCTGIAKGTTQANIEEDRLPTVVTKLVEELLDLYFKDHRDIKELRCCLDDRGIKELRYCSANLLVHIYKKHLLKNKTKKEIKKPFKSLKDFTGIDFPIHNKPPIFYGSFFPKEERSLTDEVEIFSLMHQFFKNTCWQKELKKRGALTYYMKELDASRRDKIKDKMLDKIMCLDTIKRILKDRTEKGLEVLKEKQIKDEVINKIKRLNKIKHIIKFGTSQKLEVLKKKQTPNKIKCFDEIEYIITSRKPQELEKNKMMNKMMKENIEEELKKQIFYGITQIIQGCKTVTIFKEIKEKVLEIIDEAILKAHETSYYYKSPDPNIWHYQEFMKENIKSRYAIYLPKAKQIILNFLDKNQKKFCYISLSTESLFFKQVCRFFSRKKVSSQKARDLYAVGSDMGWKKLDLPISYPKNTNYLLDVKNQTVQFLNTEGRLHQNIEIATNTIKLLSFVNNSGESPFSTPLRVLVYKDLRKPIFVRTSNLYEITGTYFRYGHDHPTKAYQYDLKNIELSYYEGSLKLQDLIDKKTKPDYKVAIVKRPTQDQVYNLNSVDYCKNNKKIYYPSPKTTYKLVILFFAALSRMKILSLELIYKIVKYVSPLKYQLNNKEELKTLTHWDKIAKRIAPKPKKLPFELTCIIVSYLSPRKYNSKNKKELETLANLAKIVQRTALESKKTRTYGYGCDLVSVYASKALSFGSEGWTTNPLREEVAMGIAQAVHKRLIGDLSENELCYNGGKANWRYFIDPSLNFVTRTEPIGKLVRYREFSFGIRDATDAYLYKHPYDENRRKKGWRARQCIAPLNKKAAVMLKKVKKRTYYDQFIFSRFASRTRLVMYTQGYKYKENKDEYWVNNTAYVINI